MRDRVGHRLGTLSTEERRRLAESLAAGGYAKSADLARQQLYYIKGGDCRASFSILWAISEHLKLPLPRLEVDPSLACEAA